MRLKNFVASPRIWYIGTLLFSWVFDGYFPFWRYAMYSTVTREVRAIVVLANGKNGSLDSFREFFEPTGNMEDLRADREIRYVNLCCVRSGLPQDRYLYMNDLRRYILGHSAKGIHPSDAVPIQLAVRNVSWDAASEKIRIEDEPFWRAWAKLKG